MLTAGVILTADLWQSNDHASSFLGKNWVPHILKLFLHFFKRGRELIWGPKKDLLLKRKARGFPLTVAAYTLYTSPDQLNKSS